jgi:predicted metal-dependent enzyme (double-stranded beta helix superfamily)
MACKMLMDAVPSPNIAPRQFRHNRLMLDPAQFTAQCLECLSSGGSPARIAQLTRLALVSQREQPDRWGTRELIHCSDDLFIVDLTLPPYGTSAIHDHGTWAVIGISQGCEVDQLVTEHEGRLAWASRHELRADDVLVLDASCIHFIANPSAQPARGIHVYGKNLMLAERRMWDPQTCQPSAMDFEQFERWERFLTGRSAAAGSVVAPAIRPT